jgi:ACS family glucarate transporter-like MFS transporter
MTPEARKNVAHMEAPAGGQLAWKRYAVIAAIFVLSFITYIARAAISAAKGPMAAELSLSGQAMGAVFGIFALGYAAAQIPAGWFADRCGPRVALAALVGLWSILTAVTGAVSTFGALLVTRFLFGAAEAGAFPGSARAFYNWLPPEQRGLANGILFSGALLGGAIAFPICVSLQGPYGWRWAFYLLAIPGILWSAFWFVFFRDYSAPAASAEPAPPEPEIRFAQTFRTSGMVLAMVQYFAGNFTFFICMTWMYPYLSDRFGLSQTEAARYSMVPLLCGSAANWVSGAFVDYLYRTGRVAWSRRLPGIIGFLLAAGGIVIVSLAFTPMAAMAGFAVAIFGVEVTISPSWAYCMDIGGKSSGSISGAMNMVGNIGAFASATAFPYLFALAGSAAPYFYVAAALNLAGALCWLQMRPKVQAKPLSAA